MNDASTKFLLAACVPTDADHTSGTLEQAAQILTENPHVATACIYTAAVLGDVATVRNILASDAGAATRKGGPHSWDALTYLCFSRYLRLDAARSESLVLTAKTLLDAGAPANTGWIEIIDQPNDRPLLESAIYGAAGIAQHPLMTKLLLDYGADPNDEETPYHVPETYDNRILQILLDSGRWNAESLACVLVRKADFHDLDGLRLALTSGADPNFVTRWGVTSLHQALRRDNSLEAIAALLDHGANPNLKARPHGESASALAARRGRGDVLRLMEERAIDLGLHGADLLIAACAKGEGPNVSPAETPEILARGGTLLAQFASNGNAEGIRCLIGMGVSPAALYLHGDGYFGIAPGSTALHVAAWRGWPAAVRELLQHGAPVNALDGYGRSALQLAVKACVDSYWMRRRSPDSVAALLEAGATVKDIALPTGYREVDGLLQSIYPQLP